jgi:hypothetical protein
MERSAATAAKLSSWEITNKEIWSYSSAKQVIRKFLNHPLIFKYNYLERETTNQTTAVRICPKMENSTPLKNPNAETK